MEYASLAIFVVAMIHVFSASRLERLARRATRHAGLLHLLGETEIVFGFWAAILFALQVWNFGYSAAVERLEALDFHEPIFVFVVMVVAGCRPILDLARLAVDRIAASLPLPGNLSFALVTLGATPLLGSFITEPAAMTVAALLLRDRILVRDASSRLKYATLAVLFVNVSIGGVLTDFAAPPVLMVARTWGWDTMHMMETFGVRAIAAVAINASLFVFLFRRELSVSSSASKPAKPAAPWPLMAAHVALLAVVVFVSHHDVLLIGTFLFFLGVVQAYRRHHSPLLLREALLVGFFLAGLVALGAGQSWWVEAAVSKLDGKPLFLGSALLTAFVDNAALTYLGSLVEGTSESFRYHLVAGAVAGGGLTVIANAPNPAGISILREAFEDGAVSPAKLLLAASIPTTIALVAFGW